MLTRPMDVLTAFPVRKSKQQKQEFRDAVQSYLSQFGYSASVEKGSLGCRNMVIGDPETAQYLITAHYDTCARLPIPNLITPCNFWAFLGYQLVVMLLMLLVPAIPGALAGLLAGSFDVGYYVWFLCVWAVIALVMIGPANKHNANDNTSGVVTLLEIARSLPESQRGKVCFVLFDLEEAGLIGSAAYRKAHKKASDSQLVLNLDCVGDGDHIRFFPTKKLKKDRKKLTSLYKACGYLGKKDVLVHEKGFSVCPSDQANFPYGVGICALRKKGKTLYLSRIHTPKDTILEETNVNILRAALITFITCGAAQ